MTDKLEPEITLDETGPDAASGDSPMAMSIGEDGKVVVTDEVAAQSAIPRDELARMTDDIIAALKTVYDPEIPSDIYEIGLIYRIDIEDDRTVRIEMTLTAPGCPVAGEMPGWVENAVRGVEGVMDVAVTMTFDPPWTPDRMSEEAQVALGWY